MLQQLAEQPTRPDPRLHGVSADAEVADGAEPAPCRHCLVRDRTVCAALDRADLHHLSAMAARLSFEAGDSILAEADPTHHVFNITRGAVKVFRQLPDGRRQVTGFLFAGDFLGLSFDGSNVYSAEALGRVLVCRYPRARFERAAEQFPSLQRRLLQRAANELVAAQDQMLLLGRKTAREKVASFLIGIVRRLTSEGGPAELPMGRADIADYLGLTIETVSRTFTEFRQRGLLVLHSAARIEIAEPARLAGVAGGFDLH